MMSRPNLLEVAIDVEAKQDLVGSEEEEESALENSVGWVGTIGNPRRNGGRVIGMPLVAGLEDRALPRCWAGDLRMCVSRSRTCLLLF